jgi:hypothetical protein
MNTYKGVVAIAINEEGFCYFGYKYFNLNYAGNVFFYEIIIFMVEVDGIYCFICIGIRTI